MACNWFENVLRCFKRRKMLHFWRDEKLNRDSSFFKSLVRLSSSGFSFTDQILLQSLKWFNLVCMLNSGFRLLLWCVYFVRCYINSYQLIIFDQWVIIKSLLFLSHLHGAIIFYRCVLQFVFKPDPESLKRSRVSCRVSTCDSQYQHYKRLFIGVKSHSLD